MYGVGGGNAGTGGEVDEDGISWVRVSFEKSETIREFVYIHTIGLVGQLRYFRAMISEELDVENEAIAGSNFFSWRWRR
jgi:hypothetical protein